VETQTRRRLSRFRRHRFTKPPLVLQDRDREIVRLVADYRVVSSEEIQALIEGSDQTILRRLQKLYHAGFLDRPRRQIGRGNSKLVYALGQRGAKLMAEQIGGSPNRDWSEENRQLTAQFLEHALMVSRFRAVITLACRQRADVELADWRQGRELWDEAVVEHADWRERIPVCPDAYFAVRLVNEPEGGNRIHLFLEADRSTMTVKRFVSKMRGYWHYWRSEQPRERFGFRNFVVLTITRSHARASNLCQATGGVDAPQHRGLRMFLFGAAGTDWLEHPGNVLEPIWKTAVDASRHSLLE
jgi:predicted transcriptional regulator